MENKHIIPFSPPDISDLEIAEVVDTLKSGWITTGPKTKKLEAEIAEFCGTKKAVTMNSATACMEMTLRLLGVGPGDEVITSAYTYSASASVIHHVGAKIVLIDTAPDSFEMDYHQLEEAINDKTKVIIPVDIAGVPCDYDHIFEIVNRKKQYFKPKKGTLQEKFDRVIVLDDAAHSFGAVYKNKKVGSIADFTSFSFHAVKNFTTGEGGAVTWNSIDGIEDEEIYRQYMLLILHGQTKDALSKTKLGSWEYDIVAPYYKYNMTDIMASIGLAQMKRYPEMLEKRKLIIEAYDNAFNNLPFINPKHYTNKYHSSGHLYLLRIEGIDEAQRSLLIEKISEVGIAINVHYKPLPLLNAYKDLGFNIYNYRNAYNVYQNEISLPLHTKLDNNDIKYIIEKVTEIVMNQVS